MGRTSDKTREKEPYALTAIPYQVSAMLRTYGRQVTTARRLARYRRTLRPVADDEDARLSREAKRRELVARVAAEIVENCIVAGSDTPVVEEIKAELEEELGFPVVFAYPPEEQEMQIFRHAPESDPEPITGEAKAAIMRRLWELALEKVDETML
jgi:alkanesulfonate monooxygenase SsuD/methylene tetrahydromethanopterin reductase-like flavin-dependent oxidoreductase (luciferase family)